MLQLGMLGGFSKVHTLQAHGRAAAVALVVVGMGCCIILICCCCCCGGIAVIMDAGYSMPLLACWYTTCCCWNCGATEVVVACCTGGGARCRGRWPDSHAPHTAALTGLIKVHTLQSHVAGLLLAADGRGGGVATTTGSPGTGVPLRR